MADIRDWLAENGAVKRTVLQRARDLYGPPHNMSGAAMRERLRREYPQVPHQTISAAQDYAKAIRSDERIRDAGRATGWDTQEFVQNPLSRPATLADWRYARRPPFAGTPNLPPGYVPLQFQLYFLDPNTNMPVGVSGTVAAPTGTSQSALHHRLAFSLSGYKDGNPTDIISRTASRIASGDLEILP